MTDKLEIPDPSTLEGEDLNYWCGVAAGYGMVRCKSGDPRTVPQEWWGRDWILGLKEMWNPIENAAGYSQGKTELIARCRAYLVSQRENDRRGE